MMLYSISVWKVVMFTSSLLHHLGVHAVCVGEHFVSNLAVSSEVCRSQLRRSVLL